MPVATSDALMGLGTPPQLSALMGGNPSKLAGLVNATQTGAAVLLSKNTELNPGSTTNSFVPSANAGVMEPYFLVNSSGQTANVFVPLGHTLTGASAGTPGLNGSLSMVTMKSAIFWQYKPKFWTAILTS